MTISQVIGILKVATSIDEDELTPYIPIIENYMSPFSRKKLNDDEDRRATMYVAAKANLYIQNVLSKEDVTSFSAGEVTVQKNGNSLAWAELFYNSALEDASDLVEDKAFDFRGV